MPCESNHLGDETRPLLSPQSGSVIINDEEHVTSSLSSRRQCCGASYVPIEPMLFGYNLARGLIATMTSLYFFDRASEMYGGPSTSSLHPCGKTTTPESRQQRDDVSKEFLQLTMMAAFSDFLTAVIPTLFLGTLTDSVGRRVGFVFPLLGVIARAVVFLLVVGLHASVYFIYIGTFLEGLGGGFGTFYMTAFSAVADITTPGRQRALRICIVEFIAVLATSLASLAGGQWRHISYVQPLITSAGLGIVTLIYALCGFPETLGWQDCTWPSEPASTPPAAVSGARQEGWRVDGQCGAVDGADSGESGEGGQRGAVDGADSGESGEGGQRGAVDGADSGESGEGGQRGAVDGADSGESGEGGQRGAVDGADSGESGEGGQRGAVDGADSGEPMEGLGSVMSAQDARSHTTNGNAARAASRADCSAHGNGDDIDADLLRDFACSFCTGSKCILERGEERQQGRRRSNSTHIPHHPGSVRHDNDNDDRRRRRRRDNRSGESENTAVGRRGPTFPEPSQSCCGHCWSAVVNIRRSWNVYFRPDTTMNANPPGTPTSSPATSSPLITSHTLAVRPHTRRWVLALCFFSFVLTVAVNSSKPSVETAYRMGVLCWDASQETEFDAGWLISHWLCILLALHVLQYRLRLHNVWLALVGSVSALCAPLVFSFATLPHIPDRTANVLVFVSAGSGTLARTLIPMLRAVSSSVVGLGEQGALFSSYACVEMAGAAVFDLAASQVYKVTAHLWKGIIFVIMAAFFTVVIVFLLILSVMLRRSYRKLDDESQPSPSNYQSFENADNISH